MENDISKMLSKYKNKMLYQLRNVGESLECKIPEYVDNHDCYFKL